MLLWPACSWKPLTVSGDFGGSVWSVHHVSNILSISYILYIISIEYYPRPGFRRQRALNVIRFSPLFWGALDLSGTYFLGLQLVFLQRLCLQPVVCKLNLCYNTRHARNGSHQEALEVDFLFKDFYVWRNEDLRMCRIPTEHTINTQTMCRHM